MSLRLVSFGLFSVILLPAQVFAGGPTITNKCKLGTVNTPTNSAGFLMDEECKNAYVLPPSVGKVSVSAVQQNQNLGFCPALRLDQEAIKQSAKTKLVIIQKINKMIKDYEPIQIQRDKLYSTLVEKKADFDSATLIYNKAATKEKDFIDQVTETKKTYDRLVLLGASPEDIKAAKDKYESTLASYKIFVAGDLTSAENNYNFTKKEYQRYNDEYAYYDSKYVESVKPLSDLQKMVDDIEEAALNSYKKYVPLEGLTATMVFNINSASLVSDFSNMNRNLNLSWQQLPIKDAYFIASLKNDSGAADASVSTVIDSSIPGIKSQTINNIDVNSPLPTLHDKEVAAQFPFGSLSGKVRLNLNGACVYYTNVNVPAPGADIQNISANISLNVNYTYQAKQTRSFTAKYNFYNMFTRIEKKSTSGGWFSTSSVHSVVEDKNSSDWFDLKFDGDYIYTKEEQDDIKREERALLIDRALRQFAMMNAGSTPPGLVSPPTSGVMYAANSLGKCYHYYCQIGSFVLGTVGSIFGSSNAVAAFKGKTNIWVEDKVTEFQIIDRSGSLTFSK
ncbi:hypothetical protein QEJ31_07005 [Pigmentibacter sp. JX0631]|uniref:hypothetical protein n=1 Tax=Pigmentibacter sp. JX0631 TaxID=2976982 RepID=UPI002469BC57|nr:hypothetical protein [Pigmentibacter sp. JX0631]WGL61341.1 hypothetical protein QEJ31_07005 [Pigmentibacter sp. JX0631]